jgi:hypothetical protein
MLGKPNAFLGSLPLVLLTRGECTIPMIEFTVVLVDATDSTTSLLTQVFWRKRILDQAIHQAVLLEITSSTALSCPANSTNQTGVTGASHVRF